MQRQLWNNGCKNTFYSKPTGANTVKRAGQQVLISVHLDARSQGEGGREGGVDTEKQNYTLL